MVEVAEGDAEGDEECHAEDEPDDFGSEVHGG